MPKTKMHAMNKDVWNEALEMKSQGFNLKRSGSILLRGVYMKLVRDEKCVFRSHDSVFTTLQLAFILQ